MILEKIFFSYSRADGSDFALRLALDLKKEGFNVWIDQEDIRAGSEWDLEIEKALETCECLLFIETEKSVTSNNVLDEVYYALEQHKKVIPLILVDSKTPFRLQRLQHIDFTKNYHSGLGLLVNELKGTTTAELFEPKDTAAPAKTGKPFYIKYAAPILIIISLVMIIASTLFYTSNNHKEIAAKNETTINSNDSGKVDNKPIAADQEQILKNKAITNEGTDKRKVTIENKNKKVNNTNSEGASKSTNKKVNLIETFAGDWKLADVDPKAASSNGYLKIDAIDENKVAIKSYVQFYYFKNNDTSFVSVFNGFAGCSSCVLAEDMKITPEDIAIGSHYYKILQQDQAEGKSGDTIMNAGANKSIRASVTLHFTNKNTAVIKVQQPASTELSHGLILKPFVYFFRFTKVD
ncbi:MAG: toll/interleukin-1 receptor domain-containing protein [Ginsengibacter sp.]